MPTSPQSLRIGLPGWVLQDGNYRDISAGDHLSFALEFWAPNNLKRAAAGDIAFAYTGDDCLYGVCAKVVHATDACVLDFGLLAYGMRRLTAGGEVLRVGDYVVGEVALLVDHFAYFDDLAHKPGMPPLIYDWLIEAIELDATPGVTVHAGDDRYPSGIGDRGPKTVSDASRRHMRALQRTSKWDDSPEGIPKYLLTCVVQDEAPSAELRLK